MEPPPLGEVTRTKCIRASYVWSAVGAGAASIQGSAPPRATRATGPIVLLCRCCSHFPLRLRGCSTTHSQAAARQVLWRRRQRQPVGRLSTAPRPFVPRVEATAVGSAASAVDCRLSIEKPVNYMYILCQHLHSSCLECPNIDSFMPETKKLRISQKHSMRAIFMQI